MLLSFPLKKLALETFLPLLFRAPATISKVYPAAARVVIVESPTRIGCEKV